MDLHHLQGQAGAEVALIPVHDAEQRGDIMGKLRAATVAVVIDVAEIILEADPAAHGDHRAEDRGEGLVFRIKGCVVADQEGAAIEEQPTGAGAAADDRGRIGAMAVFRTGLAEMLRPLFDMAQGLRSRGLRGGGLEPAGPLEGVGGARTVKGGPQGIDLGAMSRRQTIQVEKVDAITASVVVAADEPSIIRNDDALGSQKRRPHLRTVRHGGEQSGVRTAAAAAARAAIVGGLMRIVDAGAAVAEDDHETRMPGPQAGRSEDRGDAVGHLLRRETLHEAGRRLLRGLALAHEAELGARFGEEQIVDARDEAAEAARAQHAEDEREKAERSEQRGADGAAKDRAAAHRRLPTDTPPEPADRLTTGLHRRLERRFAHLMGRLDHDRTERDAPGVVDAGVIDGAAEEAGRAEGQDGRTYLLERAAEGFLPIVDAEHDLRARPSFRSGGRRSPVLGQGDEDLPFMTPLIGEVPDAAALKLVEGLELATQRAELGVRERGEFGAGQAEQLGRVIQPRRLGQGVVRGFRRPEFAPRGRRTEDILKGRGQVSQPDGEEIHQ